MFVCFGMEMFEDFHLFFRSYTEYQKENVRLYRSVPGGCEVDFAQLHYLQWRLDMTLMHICHFAAVVDLCKRKIIFFRKP